MKEKYNKFIYSVLKILSIFIGDFNKKPNSLNWIFYRKYTLYRLKTMNDDEWEEHIKRELSFYENQKINH